MNTCPVVADLNRYLAEESRLELESEWEESVRDDVRLETMLKLKKGWFHARDIVIDVIGYLKDADECLFVHGVLQAWELDKDAYTFIRHAFGKALERYIDDAAKERIDELKAEREDARFDRALQDAEWAGRL